jgi:hypothetical protein
MRRRTIAMACVRSPILASDRAEFASCRGVAWGAFARDTIVARAVASPAFAAAISWSVSPAFLRSLRKEFMRAER